MSTRPDVPIDDPKERWLRLLTKLVYSPPTLSPQSTQGKTATGYDPGTGEYTGRPKKPSSLKGTDEAGDPLTAHHLYPWNKLRSDLNAALKDPTGAQMKAVLEFAQHTPPSGFYTELAKDCGDRCEDFTTWVNAAAKALCWGPANIFMGPLGDKRGDDPGHDIDSSRMKSGVVTPASAVADLLDQQGGIAKASKLTRRLAQHVREAQVDESGEVVPRPYDKRDWEADDKDKRVRRARVPIKPEGGNIPEDEDKEWTPTKKTTTITAKPKSVKPHKTPEEIERLRAEAAERKLAKLSEVVEEPTEDEDSEGGFGGLFDEDT